MVSGRSEQPFVQMKRRRIGFGPHIEMMLLDMIQELQDEEAHSLFLGIVHSDLLILFQRVYFNQWHYYDQSNVSSNVLIAIEEQRRHDRMWYAIHQ
jgi:hypothetical protein